jgi:methylglyoxal synthase
MKPVLVQFLKEREEWLWGRKLIATGLTADFIEEKEFKVPVEHLSAGRDGGYTELAQYVDEGMIELVLFFRDPEIEQDYESEIEKFIKTCIRRDVPMAHNPSSAELLILGLIRLEASKKVKERRA